MKMKLNLIPRLVFLSLGLLLLMSNVYAEVPAKLEKKLDKAIEKYLESSDFEKLEIVYDPDIVDLSTESTIFYKLVFRKKHIGYMYVDKAFGRYEGFFYMFLTNKDFKIENVSILEYSSEYGNEITNEKWLGQFIGFTPDSEIKYKENVDAISGATISSKSITEAIALGLQKLVELKEKEIL